MPADTKKDNRKQVLFLCSQKQEMISKITVQSKSTEILSTVVISQPQTLQLFSCVCIFTAHKTRLYFSFAQMSILVFGFFDEKSVNITKIGKKDKKITPPNVNFSFFDRIKPLLLKDNMLK